MRKKISFVTVILFLSLPVLSQKIDSICFHLYTDSLKKGQHNYINIDGKLSNGHWLPLSVKEIQFTSSAGEFQGNDLILPADFNQEKIKIKAILKNNPNLWKEITIWVKKLPDPERLPSKDEILKNNSPKKKRGKM